MQQSARVAGFGVGVVGLGTLYHLAQLGCLDVVLIERKEQTSKSMWYRVARHPLSNGAVSKTLNGKAASKKLIERFATPETSSPSIWAQINSLHQGVSTQSLIDDPRGCRTMLMKVEPAPFGALHAHDEIEQIYVIEGDFFDDEKSYGPGDFVVRAPGALQRTGSKNGAITLLMCSPPAAPQT